MKHKGTVILLIVFIVSGVTGCILVLRDYLLPMFSNSEGSAVLDIETYIDGGNQPTHPSVIDMKQMWHGFRYWMAYSPYPYSDGAEENPCVCASNDMVNWTTPEGLYNPIAFNEETACDELKDPHIVYNDDLDRMEVWYLGRIDSTIESGGTLLLFRKVSTDGLHWSEYEIMRTLDGYLSPSIIYLEGKYKMWAIKPSTAAESGALVHSESKDGQKWSSFETCEVDGNNEINAIWHGAVSFDSSYRLVYIDSSGKSDTIWYSQSEDGIVWEKATPIIRKSNFWDGYYRPCVLYSDSQFYCIYGVITQDNEWYLSMSMGDSIDDLRGISAQDVGDSEINTSILETHTFSCLVKKVYHFVQSLCRPELILICIMVAVVLIFVRKCSFELLWGSSWILCVLRFWGQIRWDTVPEKLLLLFTIGGISGLCALAIKKAAEPYCLK